MANSKAYNSYIKILKKIVKDYDNNVKDNTCLMKETFLLTLAKVGSLVDPEDSNGKKDLSPDERDLSERIQTILQKEAEKWNQLFLEDIQNFKSFISDQLNANQNEMVALIHKLPENILEEDLIVRLKDHLAGNLPTDHIVDYISPLTQSDKAFHEMHQNLKKINEELFKIDQTNGCVLKNILLDIQYFWTSHFNNEAIMMFLYADMDKEPFTNSDCSAVRTVVKKHQQLFQDMYRELKKMCPNIDTLLDMKVVLPASIESKKLYVKPEFIMDSDIPHYDEYQNPHLVYLHLKKLFALYETFREAKPIYLFSSTYLSKHLVDLEKILTESQLITPFYVEQKKLIKCIADALSVRQTDLAKLMNITKQSVNESPGTSWVFKSITELSLTFLCGQTTFPKYGKTFDNNDHYIIKDIFIRHYATFIIDIVACYIKYDNEVEASNKIVKMNHRDDFSDPLSAKSHELATLLKSSHHEYNKIYNEVNILAEKLDMLEMQKANLENNDGQITPEECWDIQSEIESLEIKQQKIQENLNRRRENADEYKKILLGKMDDFILDLQNKHNPISLEKYKISAAIKQCQDKIKKLSDAYEYKKEKHKQDRIKLKSAKNNMEKSNLQSVANSQKEINALEKELENRLKEFISILEAF